MRKQQRGRMFLVPLVAALVAAAAFPGTAFALRTPDCWEVRGTVRDFYGTALSAMRVRVAKPCPNDPATTTTDSLGGYVLYMQGTLTSAQADVTVTDAAAVPRYESRTQTVTVRLPAPGGSGASESTAAVGEPTLTNNNFGLLYVMTPQVTPGALRPGVDLSFKASTSAPPPTSPTHRSRVIAQLGTARNELVQQGAPDAQGWTAWENSVAIASSTPDGHYTVKFCVLDATYAGGNCDDALAAEAANGVRIVSSLVKIESYVIDGTVPVIEPTSFMPADFGNMAFGSNPVLGVRMRDAGPSGLNTSTVKVVLRDETSGTESSFTGDQLVYTPATEWLRVAPEDDLVTGHVYRMSIDVEDKAGNVLRVSQNSAEQGGGFLVSSAVPSATTASIAPKRCRLEPGKTVATKTAVCEDVPVAFSVAQVALGPSRRSGAGFVAHTVPLTAATISTNGLPGVPAHNANDPAWGAKTADLLFEAPASMTDRVVAAGDKTITVGPLRVEVPATWTEASLSMPSTNTTARLDACADATASVGAAPCSPDPLSSQFIVKVADGVTDISALAASSVEAAGGRVEMVYGRGYRATVPFRRLATIEQNPQIVALERFAFRTGHVDAETARAAVVDVLSTPQLAEGLADLAAATVGFPRLVPGVGDGPAGYEVPLYSGSAMVGFAITSASFEQPPVLRITHGDLDARVAVRRAELEALTSSTVIDTQLRHGWSLSEVARFTLADGTIADVYVDSREPLEMGDIGQILSRPDRPALPPDDQLDHQRLWNASTNKTATRPCLPGGVVTMRPSSTATNTSCGGGGGGLPAAPEAERRYVPGGEAFPNYNWYRGCTPTAAAMVEAYWSQRGEGFRHIMSTEDYAAAMADPDHAAAHTLITSLRYHLQTNNDDLTTMSRIDEGMEEFEASRYVYRPTHVRDPVHAAQLKDQINNKQEPAVFSLTNWNFHCTTCGPTGYNSTKGDKIDHSVALIGYQVTNGKTYMIVHTDAAVDGDALVLMSDSTWDHAQFDYPTMH